MCRINVADDRAPKAQKNELKPWLKKQWCLSQITSEFLWHMEDVLSQYALPYDPLRPLICWDARPCFLIGEVGAIWPMSPGKARRHHDAYETHGSCCVLLAFEPHTGLRYVAVRQQRTAVDSAQFMQNLIEKHYPAVAHIRLGQANLNTHTGGAFYEVLPPAEAFALAQKFELHYTPKKGSWFNMAEIEFSIFARQAWADCEGADLWFGAGGKAAHREGLLGSAGQARSDRAAEGRSAEADVSGEGVGPAEVVDLPAGSAGAVGVNPLEGCVVERSARAEREGR